MARTINEIQREIIEAKNNEPALAQLTSNSKTAIWRLFIYIISVAIWTLEKLFDLHRQQIDDELSRLKPHTARWYREKALVFQYGYDLIEETDKFDNEGSSEEDILKSKIIKYAAVVESEESRLVIKIATEKNGILSPIKLEQTEKINAYFEEIKDAGVKITIINYPPDLLKLKIRIVRDVLLLNSDGMDIKSGKYPVNDAIKDFMKHLPFNGKMSLQALVDRIQNVEGVKDLSIDLAQSSWIDAESNGYGAWNDIDINVLPESGYFAVNLDDKSDVNTYSNITYV